MNDKYRKKRDRAANEECKNGKAYEERTLDRRLFPDNFREIQRGEVGDREPGERGVKNGLCLND